MLNVLNTAGITAVRMTANPPIHVISPSNSKSEQETYQRKAFAAVTFCVDVSSPSMLFRRSRIIVIDVGGFHTRRLPRPEFSRPVLSWSILQTAYSG